MANWVADYLKSHSGLEVVKRARGSLHVRDGKGILALCTGAPCHYWDAADGWKALDTALVYNSAGDEYGAAGIDTRIKLDRSIRLLGKTYAQRTVRVGLLDTKAQAFDSKATIPDGKVDGDSVVTDGDWWQHRLQLRETGMHETLTLFKLPDIAAKADDWLVLETQVAGASFAAGAVSEYAVEGLKFPPPRCTDAKGNEAECKRYAATDGRTQYLYTGVPMKWLANAAYPVVIDPDYADGTADGYMYGNNASYATARSTSAGGNNTEQHLYVGAREDSGFRNYRSFLVFDTSGIGAGNTVTQVNLRMVGTVDMVNGNAFGVRVTPSDWSSLDETAYDACLSTAYDVNWKTSTAITFGTQYTSPNMAVGRVNVAGSTYYSLKSSLDDAGTAPGTGVYEYLAVGSQNNTTTGNRPILTVAYSAASSAVPAIMYHLMQQGIA